ncbi:Uncharacterized protein TCM_024534 [Theobroma cacao]|uniref:Uncharacterized protein n=1 Tax=Theobroma cacao TaxID=3641 RepID=A0A061EVM9_THECC|nr:Uncharacterized protein TCM_024534 [Theobroma cacao]
MVERVSKENGSISKVDIKKRNLVIVRKVEEIWELNKILGLNFVEDKDEVIQKIVELEVVDIEGRSQLGHAHQYRQSRARDERGQLFFARLGCHWLMCNKFSCVIIGNFG